MFNNRAARWDTGKDERRSNSHSSSLPKRPGGITAIAIFQFAGAALAGLALLLAVTSSPRPVIPAQDQAAIDNSNPAVSPFIDDLTIKHAEQEEQVRREQYIGLLSVLAPVAIILSLALGIGLLMQREWARRLTMGLYAFSLVAAIFANLSTPLTGSALIGIVISGAVLFYLAQPTVRQAFR